jgi:hypothetical protein
VTAVPPLVTGADQLTIPFASPAIAETLPGGPGTSQVVTAVDGDEGRLSPAAFVATTVKVYAVPLLKPPTVALVAPSVVAVEPPGCALTVYRVMGLPPMLVGAVHVTMAEATPGIATTFVGESGTAAGTTALLGADMAPVPTALCARTVNVYDVPLASPLTVALVLPITVAEKLPGLDVTV